MSLIAAVPTFRDGNADGENMVVATDDDVTRLVVLLSQSYADTASIQCDEFAVDAHIDGDFGYLLYAGPEGYLVTEGDPSSSEIASESGFPAGSGVPIDRFTAALRELVHSHRLPDAVSWRPVA